MFQLKYTAVARFQNNVLKTNKKRKSAVKATTNRQTYTIE